MQRLILKITVTIRLLIPPMLIDAMQAEEQPSLGCQ